MTILFRQFNREKLLPNYNYWQVTELLPQKIYCNTKIYLLLVKSGVIFSEHTKPYEHLYFKCIKQRHNIPNKRNEYCIENDSGWASTTEKCMKIP